MAKPKQKFEFDFQNDIFIKVEQHPATFPVILCNCTYLACLICTLEGNQSIDDLAQASANIDAKKENVFLFAFFLGLGGNLCQQNTCGKIM